MKLFLKLFLISSLLQGCAIGSYENFVRDRLGWNFDSWIARRQKTREEEIVKDKDSKSNSRLDNWRMEWVKKNKEKDEEIRAYNHLGNEYYEYILWDGGCITRYRINPERTIDAYKMNCPQTGRDDKEWKTDKMQTIFLD